jgi:hypothetical protein
MSSARRLIAVAALVAALLVVPAAAQARSALIPPSWGTSGGEKTQRPMAAPEPSAPRVDTAVVGCGALILVALLGCGGRILTLRLA